MNGVKLLGMLTHLQHMPVITGLFIRAYNLSVLNFNDLDRCYSELSNSDSYRHSVRYM